MAYYIRNTFVPYFSWLYFSLSRSHWPIICFYYVYVLTIHWSIFIEVNLTVCELISHFLYHLRITKWISHRLLFTFQILLYKCTFTQTIHAIVHYLWLTFVHTMLIHLTILVQGMIHCALLHTTHVVML